MTYNPRFARYTARFLRVVYWLMLLSVAVFLLLFILDMSEGSYNIFSMFGAEIRLELEDTAYALSAPALGLESVGLENVQGDVSLYGASQGNMWLALGMWLSLFIYLALLIYSLRLLVKLFSSIAKGDPFQPKNLYRLRVIGWLSVASYFLDRLYELISARIISSYVVSERGVTLATGFDSFNFWSLEILVFGLGALALAEVFRYALAVQTALYEEQSSTV